MGAEGAEGGQISVKHYTRARIIRVRVWYSSEIIAPSAPSAPISAAAGWIR